MTPVWISSYSSDALQHNKLSHFGPETQVSSHPLMRSRTEASLPGRCPRCWVLVRHCVCAELPRVDNTTQVVILRHETEAQKSTGTARIAELVLRRVRVVPHSIDRVQLLPMLENCWLLYPGGPSKPAALPPQCLIALDGTWAQSRRMLKRMPELAELPWLSMPPKAKATLQLRSSPHLEGRSTLEAIADALAILEGDAIADPLHRAHQLFVQRVLRARGMLRS